MFGDGGYWYGVKDGDARARALFDRHYSRHCYKDGRKPLLFVGPGVKVVLLTLNCDALFVWRKFISGDGQKGVNCAIYRNESAIPSSVLLCEAETIARQVFGSERLYTYVNPRKVRSGRPGYCFLKAGWQQCGITKVHKLLILEKTPPRRYVSAADPLLFEKLKANH